MKFANGLKLKLHKRPGLTLNSDELEIERN